MKRFYFAMAVLLLILSGCDTGPEYSNTYITISHGLAVTVAGQDYLFFFSDTPSNCDTRTVKARLASSILIPSNSAVFADSASGLTVASDFYSTFILKADSPLPSGSPFTITINTAMDLGTTDYYTQYELTRTHYIVRLHFAQNQATTLPVYRSTTVTRNAHFNFAVVEDPKTVSLCGSLAFNTFNLCFDSKFDNTTIRLDNNTITAASLYTKYAFPLSAILSVSVQNTITTTAATFDLRIDPQGIIARSLSYNWSSTPPTVVLYQYIFDGAQSPTIPVYNAATVSCGAYDRYPGNGDLLMLYTEKQTYANTEAVWIYPKTSITVPFFEDLNVLSPARLKCYFKYEDKNNGASHIYYLSKTGAIVADADKYFYLEPGERVNLPDSVFLPFFNVQ